MQDLDLTRHFFITTPALTIISEIKRIIKHRFQKEEHFRINQKVSFHLNEESRILEKQNYDLKNNNNLVTG